MASFKVTFLPAQVTVDVDPAIEPARRHGRPGSLLDIAMNNHIPMESACGGVGVCGTCHVIVEEGGENLSPADDDEMDVIDSVPGSCLASRLSCRAVVRGDVTVRIPGWNRNAVVGGHGEDNEQ